MEEGEKTGRGISYIIGMQRIIACKKKGARPERGTIIQLGFDGVKRLSKTSQARKNSACQ
jgi:hypothetical protein